MTDIMFNRFKDAPWFSLTNSDSDNITLVGGAGGIGSWLTFLLARAGFSPMPQDFDSVEEHNLGGQIFARKHIGKSKAISIKEIVKEFSGPELYYIEERLEEHNVISTLCTFSCFDKMEPRRILFENWVDHFGNDHKAIFIDGRLQAEHMQILCIRGEDHIAIERYKTEYLFSDDEVEDAPCTFRQTSHAAAMIASHMVGFFTNHITNVTQEADIRRVPFYWEYFIPMDFIETKTP